MKRRVLIIANPGKTGAVNYCEGVFRDKENYTSFFKSGYGGYYSDSEIRTFDKPSKQKIKDELSALSIDEIEFSILIFCGHGYYSSVSNSNIFHLNDTEDIDSLEFRKNAKKRIIIEDNCREVCHEYINDSRRLIKGFSAVALYEQKNQQITPTLCRFYYNQRISDCPEQIIVAMACNIGEFAGDSSSSGGYYSSSLLKKTIDDATDDLKTVNLSQSHRIYNFPAKHNEAVPLVVVRSGNTQNPQIEKPRIHDSKNYLPFAVIA